LAYHKLQIYHDFGPVKVVGTQIKLNTGSNNILNTVLPQEINQLQPALAQLSHLFPTTTIYLGHFSIHHPILGSTKMDKPREKVTQWADDQNLVILSYGSPTRIEHHYTGCNHSTSHLHHFSLASYKETTTLPKSWVYTKVNWSKFTNPLSIVKVEHLADDNTDQNLEKKSTK
jgi:hypothetical protein